MGQLLGKDKRIISEHFRTIFNESELDENVVVRNSRTTTQHGAIPGKTEEHEVKGYNMDVIISVDYRVKSVQGTKLRIWATRRLKEYIIKGFTLNDARIKSGNESFHLEIHSLTNELPTLTKNLDQLIFPKKTNL